jgi:DNA (cytosine-5)-methyltransferase 1
LGLVPLPRPFLAGAGAGLKGERSGTFWPFWKLVKALGEEDRHRAWSCSKTSGALSSHDGKDFAAICAALAGGGYRFGAVIINAVHFVPQSRPRLFIIGVRKSSPIPRALIASGPEGEWHPSALVEAYGKLSKRSQSSGVVACRRAGARRSLPTWWKMSRTASPGTRPPKPRSCSA